MKIRLSDRWVRRQLVEQLEFDEKLKVALRESLKLYGTIAELAGFPVSVPLSALQPASSRFLMASKVRAALKTGKIIFQHSKVLESRGLSSVAKNLDGIIEKLPDFQSFIYATDEFYRDHIEHQIRVAVLGDFLLSQQFNYAGEECTLIDRVCSSTSSNEHDVRKAWWIAGLFHDIGMPVAKLAKNLNDFMKDLAEVYGHIDLVVPEIGCPVPDEKVNRSFFEVLSKGFPKPVVKKLKMAMGWGSEPKVDHGAFSALLMLRSIPELVTQNPYELEVSLTSDFKEYLTAAQAIMLHNLYEHDNMIKIDSGKHPLAYLLVCCDEMQEWSRDVSIKERSKFDPKFSVAQLMDHCFLEISNDKLELSAEFKNQKVKDMCGFIFDYYVKEKKKNFERLSNASGVFPNISIVLTDFVFHDDALIRKVPEAICSS